MLDRDYLQRRLIEFGRNYNFINDMVKSRFSEDEGITELDARGFIDVYRSLVELSTLLKIYNENYPTKESIKGEEKINPVIERLEEVILKMMMKE